MRTISFVAIGVLLLTGGVFLVTGPVSRGTPQEDKPKAKDDAEDPKDWRDAFQKMREQIQDRAEEHKKLKDAYEEELEKQKMENEALHKAIEDANDKRQGLEAYFEKNNTRIAWKPAVLDPPAGKRTGKKDGSRLWWKSFTVDFAPEELLSDSSFSVLLSGISCQRWEHKVSNFYAITRGVKVVEKTKVTGEYRFNLSDNDDNNSFTDETKLHILVMALIKPKPVK